MTLPTDVGVGDRPVTGSCPGDATAPGATACTDEDLDAMDAILDLQVEEVAYRATLQALERPLVAGLQRFFG